MELFRDTRIAFITVNELVLDSDSAYSALSAVKNVLVRIVVPELAYCAVVLGHELVAVRLGTALANGLFGLAEHAQHLASLKPNRL
jgi:hypothetical protein